MKARDSTVDSTRSALIIASYDYTDAGLRRLRAPASDAQALAGVLRDPGIGGFDVQTLLNKPAYEVNLAVEEFFADRRPDDLLLVHFSCHGVKDEDGELYFATANTVLRALGATAVAAEFVNRRMSRSRSRRVVLLLDCCYAGAFERGMTARAGAGVGIEAQFGGRGRAVITASSAMEYAFEGGELADSQELQPSVFTSALVEGLRTGEADRDQDGMVALDELYDYVYDKVRMATPNQTPGKWTFGVQGDLYIARRARPVTTPSPLPSELHEAMDSPLAAVRAAAVQELVRLLQGRHAGLALGARVALQRLTEDDSRMVAAAAAQALGAPAPPEPTPPTPPEATGPTPPEPRLPMLALSATVVDFGKLSLRGQSAERTVRLENAGGGSLNARAATRASWLHLRQVGDDLVITVDTSSVGDYDDFINVDSDGGSARIRILARVESAARPGPVPAAGIHAEAEPAWSEGDRGSLSNDAARVGTHTASADVAAAAAATTPTPTTRGASVAGPTAGPTPASVRIDHRAPPRPYGDRLLLIAGGLAIVGAVLGVVGLFPSFISDAQRPFSLWSLPEARWYVIIASAVELTAGICIFAPRTRRLIGPGLLLGTAADPVWSVVVIVVTFGLKGAQGGLWLGLAGALILVVADCLAGLVLARAGEARLVRPPPRGALLWAVALLGVAGALALVFHDQGLSSEALSRLVAPSIVATVMALVIPVCATLVMPRRFAVSLLIGWVGVGTALFVYYHVLLDAVRSGGTHTRGGPIIVFGVTLLALLIVTVLLAFAASRSRADPTSQVEPTTRG